jgi:ribosomal protein S12 methylthiotransferase
MKNKKLCAHIVSLGCPKNTVDSEIIAGTLIKNGIAINSSPENCNIMIINTCAFIAAARNESEKHIKAALKWRKKCENRKLIVCGCFNQLDPDAKISPILGETDLRLGVDELEKIADKILEIYSKTENKFCEKPRLCQMPSYIQNRSSPRLQLTPPHYAYIKISDGCSNHCSYCVIPLIRGNFRSRPADDIIFEAKNLLNNGCREIILIGQDTSNYGADKNDSSKRGISFLIREIDNLNSKDEFWIRLMYCHPRHLNQNLLNVFQNSPHLLPYLDIPLQHISDKILKKMNRGVSSRDVAEIFNKIKQLGKNIALRTTFIVGFPGEDEDDFNELLSFVKGTKFDRLGVFKYSPEPNTTAFSMKDQVSPEIVEERFHLIMDAQRKISLKKNIMLKGTEIKFIIDKQTGKNKYLGRTIYDAPEIDNVIIVRSEKKISPGQIVNVKITSAKEYSLAGEYITK